MAKPILIVRANFEGEVVNAVSKSFNEHLNHEYHIFFLLDPKHTDTTFECFNADKAPDIDIEYLKKLVNTPQEKAQDEHPNPLAYTRR